MKDYVIIIKFNWELNVFTFMKCPEQLIDNISTYLIVIPRTNPRFYRDGIIKEAFYTLKTYRIL
jgi:hypothetical protein